MWSLLVFIFRLPIFFILLIPLFIFAFLIPILFFLVLLLMVFLYGAFFSFLLMLYPLFFVVAAVANRPDWLPTDLGNPFFVWRAFFSHLWILLFSLKDIFPFFLSACKDLCLWLFVRRDNLGDNYLGVVAILVFIPLFVLCFPFALNELANPNSQLSIEFRRLVEERQRNTGVSP